MKASHLQTSQGTETGRDTTNDLRGVELVMSNVSLVSVCNMLGDHRRVFVLVAPLLLVGFLQGQKVLNRPNQIRLPQQVD